MDEMNDSDGVDYSDLNSLVEEINVDNPDVINLSNNQNSDLINGRNLAISIDTILGGTSRVVGGGDPNRVIVPPILEPVTHYNRYLTSAHKYLGNTLQETLGRTIFEENVVHTIPVVFFKLHLMPGQILPIIARSADIRLLLKYVLARNRAFGVLYKLNPVGQSTYGTIAEVFEHSELSTSEQFQVKAMGHQRFKIIKVSPFADCCEQAFGKAQIIILPDVTLSHPFNKLCLHPKNRNSRHSEICRKKDMWQTPWPDWVYKQTDANNLASIVARKVKLHYKRVDVSDDPYLLSFQVARLGLFTPDQVNFLLGVNSTNLRLQYELHYWKWNQIQSTKKFKCAFEGCGTVICDISNTFPMSPEGPHGSYCNSWGQVHDLITVTELDNDLNVIHVGNLSDDCCWFPGYKWVIILCPQCHGHLGWRYLADENLSLIPRSFYGLSVRSITSRNINSTRGNSGENLMSDLAGYYTI